MNKSNMDTTGLSSANVTVPEDSNSVTDQAASDDDPQYALTADDPAFPDDGYVACTSDVREGLNLGLQDVRSTRVCGLCDKNFAEGRCLDCDEDLCSVCVKYHEKLKITSTHNILFIDPPANLEKVQHGSVGQKMRITCPKHEDELLKFFCKSCKVPVCRDCILTSHKDHVTGDILDEAQGAKEQVQIMLVKAENTKRTIEGDHEKLKEYEGEFLESIQKVSAIVKQLYKDISDRVEESHQNLVDTIQSTKNDELSRIQHCEEFYKQKLVSISDVLYKGEKLLSSETDMEMVLEMDVLRQTAPGLCSVRSIKPVKAEFVLSGNRNLARNTAENIIGHVSLTVTEASVQDGGKHAYIREVCLKRDIAFHIWEMKCTKPSVRGICEGSNGIMWVATPKSLLKLGTDGRRQNSIHLTSDVSCITKGHEGKLLVAFSRGNGIKILSHDAMNIWSTYATIPETVMAISTTSDKQRVFVASAAAQNLYIICNHGKDMVRVPLPEDLSQSDAVITGMAVGSAGEVAISNSSGKLVILSDSFEAKYVYKGPDGVMFPTSICYDKQGHLIVADGKRYTVHLVSKSGRFLAFLLKKDDFQDIGAPTAVCVDECQRLWVGTDMGNVCAYTYIHDVL
ncbi:E3 ubiquitin-protein ligase TRIM71-like [Gigantopelta aegis]|uniref:E3 ubiquitin-protein ligase TRIM71-like n=1 Tax=Gigantopelta aegis TaxID=1735272 RepID=UPI001B887F85|nr:E3 ubiquitin-protein ligase TRIM71-like [Gigantopelta aegis]